MRNYNGGESTLCQCDGWLILDKAFQKLVAENRPAPTPSQAERLFHRKKKKN